ncbi:MAG: ATP-dependent sacrificial sulfur transferase LarE [Ignavibacteria bacterium]|nr:ATP-dependent sacrificial sulfur transferase LarE [Ignavibacteria bacterium]
MKTLILEQKLLQLQTFIAQYDSAIVAYSGGVDSSFLLKTARDILGKENVLAATGDSPSFPRKEKLFAIEQAEQFDVNHIIIQTEELQNEHYFSNPSNRCYFCKTELFTKLSQLQMRMNFNVIFDGTNFDDRFEFRPGSVSAKEHNIVSPLAFCKFSKEEIRFASHHLHLLSSEKPASPCLASRIPYGNKVTIEKLSQIEYAENIMHELGFNVCRVRHHDSVARIEVPTDVIHLLTETEIRAKLVQKFRQLGFHFITLDLNGFTSGNLNTVLSADQQITN